MSLPPKIEDNNVKGFSRYPVGDFKNLDDPQKKGLVSQEQKKLFEITENVD